MNLLEKSDDEIIKIASPIWSNLVKSSNIKDYGGRIDKIYYCPHLKSKDCRCRKPKAGMIEDAFYEFPFIDASNSYMVGDSSI